MPIGIGYKDRPKSFTDLAKSAFDVNRPGGGTSRTLPPKSIYPSYPGGAQRPGQGPGQRPPRVRPSAGGPMSGPFNPSGTSPNMEGLRPFEQVLARLMASPHVRRGIETGVAPRAIVNRLNTGERPALLRAIMSNPILRQLFQLRG